MATARRIAALAALLSQAVPALAACPQELAVYEDRDKVASLQFRPAPPTAAVHEIEFDVAFRQNGVMLSSVVMWTADVPRPTGLVLYECPQGDVTGQELAACTVWQGVIYGISSAGEVTLMPRRGEAAAAQLLLPDFAPAVRQSSAFGEERVSILPWDVFQLSGCQE